MEDVEAVVSIDGAGRVIIPKEIRERKDLKSGKYKVYTEKGKIILIPKEGSR